jgi:hypothetical protein
LTRINGMSSEEDLWPKRIQFASLAGIVPSARAASCLLKAAE